jgi:hypothetical protein
LNTLLTIISEKKSEPTNLLGQVRDVFGLVNELKDDLSEGGKESGGSNLIDLVRDFLKVLSVKAPRLGALAGQNGLIENPAPDFSPSANVAPQTADNLNLEGNMNVAGYMQIVREAFKLIVDGYLSEAGVSPAECAGLILELLPDQIGTQALPLVVGYIVDKRSTLQTLAKMWFSESVDNALTEWPEFEKYFTAVLDRITETKAVSTVN